MAIKKICNGTAESKHLAHVQKKNKTFKQNLFKVGVQDFTSWWKRKTHKRLW